VPLQNAFLSMSNQCADGQEGCLQRSSTIAHPPAPLWAERPTDPFGSLRLWRSSRQKPFVSPTRREPAFERAAASATPTPGKSEAKPAPDQGVALV